VEEADSELSRTKNSAE